VKTNDRRALREAAELLDENAEVIQRSDTRPDGSWPNAADRLEFNKHQRLAIRLRAIADAMGNAANG
jgi:hypothetical protein